MIAKYALLPPSDREDERKNRKPAKDEQEKGQKMMK
jgi:hypothetical protein